VFAAEPGCPRVILLVTIETLVAMLRRDFGVLQSLLDKVEETHVTNLAKISLRILRALGL
jgi:hypothetical protein